MALKTKYKSKPKEALKTNNDGNGFNWKVLSSKEVYKNKWMSITEDDVVTEFGEHLLYGVVRKKPFALIIPWDGKCFTLVGQYRYSIQKHSWEFPQGHFEHKNINETAKAELKEETGLSAGSIKVIGEFHLAPGHSSQICKVFLAEKLIQGKSELGEGEKGIKVKKVTLNKLDEMVTNKLMKDGPSLAALTIFKNYIENKTK